MSTSRRPSSHRERRRPRSARQHVALRLAAAGLFDLPLEHCARFGEAASQILMNRAGWSRRGVLLLTACGGGGSSHPSAGAMTSSASNPAASAAAVTGRGRQRRHGRGLDQRPDAAHHGQQAAPDAARPSLPPSGSQKRHRDASHPRVRTATSCPWPTSAASRSPARACPREGGPARSPAASARSAR
jgi:hypothetical protein